MVSVYLEIAVHGPEDLVDAERLAVFLGGGFCQDDAPLGQVSGMSSHDGIGHGEIIRAVFLARNFAAGGVCQRAKPVAGKIQHVVLEKYRFHRVHHLGVTITPVMPPLQLTVFSPGCSVGYGPLVVGLMLVPSVR